MPRVYNHRISVNETQLLLVGQAEELAPSWDIAVSISPSGGVRPIVKGMSAQRPDAISISFEGFEQAALKVKNDILSGQLVPGSKEAIQRLVFEHRFNLS